MNINVSVDEVTLDTVVASIISRDEETGEGYEAGHETIGHLVAQVIVDRAMSSERWRDYATQVISIRAELIREAVSPMIAEAIARPIKTTNNYGEATGQETTLTEVIIEQARKTLNAPADGSGYGSQQSFIQKTVAAEVKAALGAEIADAVKAARQQVAGEIGSHVAAAVQAGLKAR